MGDDNKNPNLTTCPCNTCSGHLQFEAENAGTTIECPHCGVETVLFIPNEWKEKPPKPEPKRATRVRKLETTNTSISGKLELYPIKDSARQKRATKIADGLEGTGRAFLAVGILGCVFCLFGVLGSIENGGIVLSIWVLSAVGSLGQGFIIWQLFAAASQVIRLLESLHQVQTTGAFTGEMHPPIQNALHHCSLCLTPAHADQPRCGHCGAEFSETVQA